MPATHCTVLAEERMILNLLQRMLGLAIKEE